MVVGSEFTHGFGGDSRCGRGARVNGVIDVCDLVMDPTSDCNGNGIFDICENNQDVDCDQSGVPDVCEIANGILQDSDGDGVPDVCRCVGDVVQDDVVDTQDLIYVIDHLGDDDGPADADGNGVVDIIDILVVLDGWGVCGV